MARKGRRVLRRRYESWIVELSNEPSSNHHQKVNGITREGIDAIREFYAQAYFTMPTFRITEPKITGFTPEFVVAEMRCEGKVAIDLPHAGLKAGETMHLVGVSLFWWRWEGEGAEWDGSLSDEAVRGWKIVRERSYYNVASKA